jgi:hypothetical protein
MHDIRVLEQRIQEVKDDRVGAIARDGDIGGLINVPHTATGVRGDFDGTQMGTSDTGTGLGESTEPRNYTKRLVISWNEYAIRELRRELQNQLGEWRRVNGVWGDG